MADNQRILLGSTAEVECKLGPTPFIINSITLKIGDKTVGVSNTPTAVKGSAAPGTATSSCPPTHPYSYKSGADCCAHPTEGVDSSTPGCDGGPIGFDSPCCLKAESVSCPTVASAPCRNYGMMPETGVYSSKFSVTGSEDINGKDVSCSYTVKDYGYSETTRIVQSYVIGIVSHKFEFPGSYFESDVLGGNFSEDATLYFEVLVADSVVSVGATWKSNTDAQGAAIAWTSSWVRSGSQIGMKQLFKSAVPEALKKVGTVTFTAKYSQNAEASSQFVLPVKQFCKISDLQAVDRGTWSPALKVDFMGFATLSCNEDSYIEGNALTQCRGKFGTDESEFDVKTYPKCIERKTELKCGDLKDTPNGSILFKDGNTAYYACDYGYRLVGDAQDYTCDSQTGQWSIVTTENPNGDPPQCQILITATSRKANLELSFKSTSPLDCQNPTTRTILQDGIKTTLETQAKITCTTSSECSLEGFTCSYDAATTEVDMDFVLRQTQNLADKGVLDRDVAKIQSSISTMEYQIGSTRKREAITLSQGSVKKTETTTTCPANSVTINNECTECPAGYGVNSAQDKCEICDYGSWSPGGYMTCTPCLSSSLTTQLRGSTNALNCIARSEVCVVGGKESLNGALVPPTGSRVLQSTTVTAVCPDGSNQEFGVSDQFLCSQEEYPICHDMCNLEKYNGTELSKRNIKDDFDKRSLYHNEKITITCIDEYEYKIGTRPKSKVFTCDDGNIDIGECRQIIDEVLVSVIVVVVVIVLAAIALLIVLIISQRRKNKRERTGQEIEMGAKPRGTLVIENRDNTYQNTQN
ncbi:hypothetical protein ACHWQZ_G001906 [Mnemiopsis leidyi]